MIGELQSDGLQVLAPPHALRSLAGDAANITARVSQIDGPVLLAGHSYGHAAHRLHALRAGVVGAG